MKNRNNVLHELDKMDGLISQLNFILKRGGDIKEYLSALESMKDVISQTRLYIENEPISYR